MRPTFLPATCLIMLTIAICAEAKDPERWVPPPAPQVVEGTRIVPAVEIFDGTDFILHLPKPSQADWRQTRYEVKIHRDDEQRFRATLHTRPFGRDDEVVFFTIPKDSESKFNIEVIDTASYPFKKVWSGSLDTIKVMD